MVFLLFDDEKQDLPGLDGALEALNDLIARINASSTGSYTMHRISSSIHETELCHLARSYPTIFTCSCEYHYYALHLVCRLGPSLETLKVVYEAFPDAIFARDNGGQLPIHTGCCCHSSTQSVDSTPG